MKTKIGFLLLCLAFNLSAIAQSDEAIRQFDEYQKKIAKQAEQQGFPVSV